MCGEGEAALDGRPDEETVPETEHPWPSTWERLQGRRISGRVAAGFFDTVSQNNDATLQSGFRQRGE
jgi:hypothetical protein